MFCDQTTETVAKHKHSRRAPSRAVQRRQAAPSSASQVLDVPANPVLLDIRKEFGIPNIDDFALAYCYEHHIIHLKAGANARKVVTDDGLLACIKSVGLASYSTNERSIELVSQARRYYVAAVRSANAALQDAASASRDSTLFTVIALSHFETIIGDDMTSVMAWSRHTEGVAALLHLRGLDLIGTAEGWVLFIQAITNVLSLCLRMGRRAPQHVRDIMQAASRNMHESTDPLWKCHIATLEVTDFYSDVINGRLLDPEQTISRALQLDQQLVSVFAGAPTAWKYEVVHANPSGKTEFPGYLHMYRNTLTVQVWNAFRNGRILCHSIIIAAVRRQPALGLTSDGGTAQVQASAAIVSQMSKDILATVAQHVCLWTVPGQSFEKLSTQPSGFSSVLNYEQCRLPVLRASKGFALLWSIGLAGKVASPGSEIRIAAYEKLRLAGRVLGIKQAFFLADALEQDRPSSQDRLK